MLISVLDSKLRRTEVVEGYESAIWTERYGSSGDFVITFPPNSPAVKLVEPDSKLVMDDSKYVMIVETSELATDDSGSEIIKVTGRSYEKLLIDRVAMPAFGSLTATPKWVITNMTPGDIARKIFKDICITGILSPYDIIEFVEPTGTYLPHGSISESTELISVELDPASVYDTIYNLCNAYTLGFRLVRKDLRDLPAKLYFEVYTGEDRTSKQKINPAVIFANSLDNLTNTNRLTSIADNKNIAYVFTKNGSGIVYANGVDPNIANSERRILLVDAPDIESTGSAMDIAIQQRGLLELAQHRAVYAFDGEIPGNGGYIYGIDYNLGDLVELRDSSGFGSEMRVVEQIFVSDSEGDRSYPTLSLNLTINPGSWRAWQANQAWQDVSPSILWLNA